jgi:hypothetical protein
MSKETDQLASDYTAASVELAQQTTQMGAGFYQLNNDIDFEEFYPNGVIEFIKTDDVKRIADIADIQTDSLAPLVLLTDEQIDRFNEIAEIDFLSLTSIEKTLLSNEMIDLFDSVSVPDADQFTTFINDYSKFVAAAAEENIIIPSKFRTIQVASTDISLDSFLSRTNTIKTVIIGLNNLAYPHITARFKLVGVLQGTLVDATGSTGDENINYTSIIKETGVDEIKKGNEVIITNNAKDMSLLKQQKTILDYISEDSNLIRINDPLLFDLDSTFTVKIHKFSKAKILSPGESIKIPK